MKKKFVALFVVVAAIAGSVAISTASANDPNPISVETGFACNFFDEFGQVVGPTFQSTDTVYQSGKEVLHCIGQSATGGDGTVHVFTAFGCNLLHSTSFDPKNNDRVSKSGESQLWCYGSTAGAPSSGTAGVR
jgi:hypothetical protein